MRIWEEFNTGATQIRAMIFPLHLTTSKAYSALVNPNPTHPMRNLHSPFARLLLLTLLLIGARTATAQSCQGVQISDLSATILDCETVELDWSPEPCAINYIVRRKAPGDPTWSNLGTVTNTDFIDDTVIEGNTYLYQVRPHDGSNKGGSNNPQITITNCSGCSIENITDLTAVETACETIQLDWTAQSCAIEYIVRRKTPADTVYTNIGVATINSFEDTTVLEGATYIYQVRASDGTVKGISNNPQLTVSDCIPNCQLSNITDLTATPVDCNSVLLQWSPQECAVEYLIRRKLPSDSVFTNIDITTQDFYSDITAESGVTYIYQVRPTDASGAKTISNQPQAATDSCNLFTYSYPETIVPPTAVQESSHTWTTRTERSSLYAVSVSQGSASKDCYVMYNPNPITNGSLEKSPNTHWTNFSFQGRVDVTITKLNGNITSCELYPTRKAYSAQISGNTATFEVATGNMDIPLQLYARINGNDDQPLFIFADPLETDVPDRSDTQNVDIIQTSDSISTVHAKLTSSKPYVVFEEGIHKWGNAQDDTYAGYQMPFVSNKKIYIPGGAYVIGTFAGNNVSDCKIYGRGVISACGLDRLATSTAIPYSMVYQTGSATNQILEGVVSTDPPHFHITCRGQVTIDNVKMFGWWHQTDGTVTGDNSVVQNTFMKTNDDYIKLYSNNSYHFNNTMYHQVNGAPFQFCWGGQNGDGNVVDDTYIVYSAYNPGQNNKMNTAVICARNGPNAITENNTWNGLYIDNGCHKLLGLNAQNESGSIWRNFTINDVELNTGNADSPQDGASYLTAGNASNFVNIKFVNLKINGDPITSTNTGSDVDGDGKIWFKENGNLVDFE